MPKILVVGGTGMLGRPVVTRLYNDKYDLRVMSSNLERADLIFGGQVECVAGDVADIESLKMAMSDCDQVYINLKGGYSDERYIEIEEVGAKNIYQAAVECGIKKIVQISGASAWEKNGSFSMIKAKVEAQKALMQSGITYTILKPSWFFESLPLFRQGQKVVYVGSGKTEFHFLAASDYAKIVAQCFSDERTDNKQFVVFGAEKMSIPDALRRFLSISYPHLKIETVPVWLAKYSAFFTFNKRLKQMLKFLAFYDSHDDSMVEIGPDAADTVFGRCQTTVEDWSLNYRKVIKGE